MPLYLIKRSLSRQEESHQPHFVGKEACVECHYNECVQWQDSPHAKAMSPATDSTVLGDFDNANLETADGIQHLFYKQNGEFYVRTLGAGDTLENFKIAFTFGYEPLQQYLIAFPGGRLQCLPLAWNTEANVWFSLAEELYPNETMNSHNWLYWTNQAQNWNSMCADCHSTNLQKNYNVDSDVYHTTYSEINVSCEACHGPASEHIKWANLAEYARPQDTNYGLVIKTSDIENDEYVELCARCHSRREALGDNDFSAMYNHMIPELPKEPNYYIDGQILNEDYVFASFTQSKMYMRDVKCNDCHNVHSTKRLFDDNRLCTQCHRADDYDTPKHHFHKYAGEDGEAVVDVYGKTNEVGSGALCINCHMPQQPFMGIDFRADHSLRIPRPDLSIMLGTPNACNQCHADKSAHWAESYIEEWYGESRKSQYGAVFKMAEEQNPKTYHLLMKIFEDDVYPENIRAIALEKMLQFYPDSSVSEIRQALLNSCDMIRHTAVRNFAVYSKEDVALLLPMLNDGSKAIRLEVAAKLYVLPENMIPEKYRGLLKKTIKERLTALEYNADFPGGKLNLGNYYYNIGDDENAVLFYNKALQQDSMLSAVKVNLAYLYNQQKQYDKAEQLFLSYIKDVPNDGNVVFSYALFLSERGRYQESLDYMLKAAELSPENERISYNISKMCEFLEKFPPNPSQ